MAELALAIIPLGITVCSGLVSFFNSLGDRGDALARLARQAETIEASFRLLDAALKREQLDSNTSPSVVHALDCLKQCETSLNDLKRYHQRLSSPVESQLVLRKKVRESIRRLYYPMRQSQGEQLEKALNHLCTPLNLALHSLSLDKSLEATTLLSNYSTSLQQSTVLISNMSTVAESLTEPLSEIKSELPVLHGDIKEIMSQTKNTTSQVKAIVPQIQAIIKELLQNTQTSSYDTSGTKGDHASEGDETLSDVPPNNQVSYIAACQLASKPNALAMAASHIPRCCCQPRRYRTRKGHTFGPIQVVDEVNLTTSHHRSCQYFLPSTGHERTRSLSFIYHVSLISTAIKLYFNISTGSGGSSIDQGLRYFPMVDKRTSSAFRLLSVIRSSHPDDMKPDAATIARAFQAVRCKFQTLFESGKASPFDVDSDHNTLLHEISKMHMYLSGKQLFASLIDFLVTLGTPVSTCNRKGLLPIQEISRYILPPTALNTNIYIDYQDELSYRRRCFFENSQRFEYFVQHPSLAQSLHGPLSTAIIQNDYDHVQRLLARSPGCINERSFYGQNAFHLAIYRPKILALLADKATPALLVRKDKSRLSCLGLALSLSQSICDTSKSLGKTTCPCTHSIRMLLHLGCPIIPFNDFRGDSFSLSDASLHCKNLVAKELRARRRRLRDLARLNFSESDFRRLCSVETELDVSAFEVDRLLRQKGIVGFGELSAFIQGWEEKAYHHRTLYFDLDSPDDADLFFDLGFSTIDIDQIRRPSLYRKNFFYGPHPLWFHLDPYGLSYAVWLYDHGATLWKWDDSFYHPVPSIFILAKTVACLPYPKDVARKQIMEQVEKSLLTADLADSCICRCSPGGCTPFALRMKYLAWHRDSIPPGYSKDFDYMLQNMVCAWNFAII